LPNSALLPELTRDYHERTAIIALRSLIGAIGAAIMTVLAFQVFLKEGPGGGGGVLARGGYTSFGLVSALVILVFMLVSAGGVHDRIQYLRQTPKRRLGLGAALAEIGATLFNRSFIALTAAGAFCFVALGARGGLEIYFNLYFWGLRQWQLAALAAAVIAASLLGALIAPLLSRRFGKRHAVMGVLVASVLTAVAPIGLRLVGLMPANGTWLLFAILLVDLIVNGAMSTTIGVLTGSMLADVVEDAEVRTGRRAEGLLMSAENMFWKMVSGVGVFVSGMMLAFVAFPAHAQRGHVPAEVLRNLAIVYVPSMIGIYVLTIACMSFYSIDRRAHEANLARLATSGPEGETTGEQGPAPQLAAFAPEPEAP
jgi:GPH family glycoside/pentoside/hexuronide:cation symporter